MSGSHSRQKGARAERELVKQLKAWGLAEAHRMPQIEGAPDIKAPLSVGCMIVECKRHKKANVRAALKQVYEADPDVPDGTKLIRAVYIRDDLRAPFWVIPHTSFKTLIQGYNAAQTTHNDSEHCSAPVGQLSSCTGQATCG